MPNEAPTDDDAPTYKISANTSTSVDDDADWYEPYITDLRIHIWQEWWSDEEQDVRTREVGTGEGFILHVGHAVNNGVSIAEACDDHSAEADEYRAAVITEKNQWNRLAMKQFGDDLIGCDLLAFTKMEIKPEHRGRKLGQRAILRAIQMFSGGCGLILIKPWPLQYTSKEFSKIAKEGKSSQGWTEQRRKQDFTRLRTYWGELGFERIGKSDFYGFPTFSPLPTVESLQPATDGVGES